MSLKREGETIKERERERKIERMRDIVRETEIRFKREGEKIKERARELTFHFLQILTDSKDKFHGSNRESKNWKMVGKAKLRR